MAVTERVHATCIVKKLPLGIANNTTPVQFGMMNHVRLIVKYVYFHANKYNKRINADRFYTPRHFVRVS